MVEMIDMTPGRIVIRRADNSTVLDTDTRMPAKLGSISLTGVSLEWPVTDSEYNEFLPLSGWWRHRMYETNRNTHQVLAAYPSPVAPQFFWCRYKLTDSVSGNVGGYPLAPGVSRNVWAPWVGSVLVETYGAYLIRHMNITATVGGNIVIEKRQSTIFKSTDNNIQGSTRSVHLLDIELAWGIFDG